MMNLKDQIAIIYVLSNLGNEERNQSGPTRGRFINC